MGRGRQIINRIGERFGRLIIQKELGSERVEALCDCGTTGSYRKSHVVSGDIQSCGCLRRTHSITHGLRYHGLYKIWAGIKNRCTNMKTPLYKHYGGRGITMCDEWIGSFEAFYNFAISNGWKKGLQVDRKNNDGAYEPSNCQFITAQKNLAANKRRTMSTNKTGISGVYQRKEPNLAKPWRATILVKGKSYRKSFVTFEEAVDQRRQWERDLL